MNKDFTDREEFRNDIIQLLENYQCQNIIYILSGKSGFGKSAFGQHIVDRFKGTYVCAKVKIISGENISLDEGFYFRRIAEEISDKSSIYHYPSLSEFLKNTSNSLIKKLYTRQTQQDIGAIHPVVDLAVNLYQRYDMTEHFSEYLNLFPEDSQYIYMILSEYLKECFEAPVRIVLNIENAQNIDMISLLKLNDLLKRCNNIFLLLEFTSDSDSLLEAKKYAENFYDSESHIVVKNLKKLDYKNTCEILEHMYPHMHSLREESIRRSIYLTIDGNIRQLCDIESAYELFDEDKNDSTLSFEEKNYTLTRLENLRDNHQIMLLCLVISHMGKVDLYVLKEMIYNKQYMLYLNLEHTINNLTGVNGLLKINNSVISVSHDSIIQQSIEILMLKSKINLGYTFWIEYYENKLDSCKKNKIFKKNEFVKKLCYFYSKYPPRSSGILHLFQDIRNIAINSLNPEEAVVFLSAFNDNIQFCRNMDLKNRIQQFLLSIYYESGLYDEALNLLEDSCFISEKSRILYMAILKDRLQDYEESITICNSAIEKYKNDARFVLCAKLIILISAASKNDYELCETVFEECINNTKFKNYYEYGFLLRNSEIVVSLQESIPFLEQSASHFNKFNSPIMEAHSRVSLVMNCGRIGFFGKAITNLLSAKQLLHNESIERYILLNNEVALQMCMGDFNLLLKDDLMLAMCTATTVFPKLIINKNLLILYAKNRKWTEGEEIVQYLLQQIKLEANKLNICFTYWNISYFYKQFDNVQYEIYFSEYKKMYSEITLKSSRKSFLQKNVFHKPGNEFVIEFLSYWHFPIPELE